MLCPFIRKAAQVNQQLWEPWKPWLSDGEVRSSFTHLSAPDRESELENLIRLSSRRHKHMSSHRFHNKGRYLNWKTLWNVSYSLSPLSHLLSCQSVWENPIPSSLKHTPEATYLTLLSSTSAQAFSRREPEKSPSPLPQLEGRIVHRWPDGPPRVVSSDRPTGGYFGNKQCGTVVSVCVCVCVFMNRSTQVDQQEDGTEEETPHLLNCLSLTVSHAESHNPKQLVFQVRPLGPLGVLWRWSKPARCLWLL